MAGQTEATRQGDWITPPMVGTDGKTIGAAIAVTSTASYIDLTTVPAVPAQCVVCCKEAAQVYCIPDAAVLCLACDQQIHGRNPLAARHVRVQLCELCEAVPAAVYCRQARARAPPYSSPRPPAPPRLEPP